MGNMDLCISITASDCRFSINYLILGKEYETNQTKAIQLAINKWLDMKKNSQENSFVEITGITVLELNL